MHHSHDKVMKNWKMRTSEIVLRTIFKSKNNQMNSMAIQNGTFPIGVGGRGVTLAYWLERGCCSTRDPSSNPNPGIEKKKIIKRIKI